MGAEKTNVLNKPRHNRVSYSYGALIMSIAEYQSWEIRRYLLETEAPGRFGYFTAAEDAQ